jgi:putative transposase
MAHIRRILKRYEEPGHVRCLTFSCYDRLPLFTNERIKQAFVDQLVLTRNRLHFELYGWVVMPEHTHLLLRPNLPKVAVTAILHALKRPFADKVLDRWRQLNAPILNRVRNTTGKPHFWLEGGGYDRNIISKEELFEKLVYIHNNPIKRGLVDRAADWRWSSAAWYERREGLPMDPLPI